MAARRAEEPQLEDEASIWQTAVDEGVGYKYDLERTSLLTAEEEVELALQMRAGSEALKRLQAIAYGELSEVPPEEVQSLQEVAAYGHAAKQRMIVGNIRLVRWYADKIDSQGVNKESLVQAGIVGAMGSNGLRRGGLTRAVEKFDLTLGYKLSTYAVGWIRNAMQQEIANGRSPIWVPKNIIAQVDALALAKSDLSEQLQRMPTVRELAAEMEISEEKVVELELVDTTYLSAGAMRSLNEIVSNDTTLTIGDTVADESYGHIHERIETERVAERLLGKLTVRRQLIMRMTYGMTPDDRKYSEAEIAQRIGYGIPALRQDLKAAIAQLADPTFDATKEYLPGGMLERPVILEHNAHILVRHPFFEKYRGVPHHNVLVERALELMTRPSRMAFIDQLQSAWLIGDGSSKYSSPAERKFTEIMEDVFAGAFNYADWQLRPRIHRSVLGFAALSGIPIQPEETLAMLRAKTLRELRNNPRIADTMVQLVDAYYGLSGGEPVSGPDLASKLRVSPKYIPTSAHRAAARIRAVRLRESATSAPAQTATKSIDERQLLFGEQWEIVRERALAILSPQQAEVMKVRYDAETGRVRSHAEVAEIIGTNAINASSLCVHALRNLKAIGPAIAAGTFDYAGWEDTQSGRPRTALGLLTRLGINIGPEADLATVKEVAHKLIVESAVLSDTEKTRLVTLHGLIGDAATLLARPEDHAERCLLNDMTRKAISKLIKDR